MSGDEVFALIVSGVLGLIGWGAWLGGLLFLKPRLRGAPARRLAWLAPAVSAAAMLFVLLSWSSHDVRSSGVYISFYMAMWFGWVGTLNFLLPYLGLSCRDDVLERGNTAAGIAYGGALLGLTLTFAGGNIGDGPGWWVVFFSAALATAALLLLWIVGCSISRVADSLTIDRDVATGLRTLGFFVGAGLILGRAVAGNWHSAEQTTKDFLANGWPVLALWGVAVGLDLYLRPTPSRPAPDRWWCGAVPGLIYVLAGLGAVILRGPW
jgi:uncharacterized membrane protein YjfL (UPF0719 family)